MEPRHSDALHLLGLVAHQVGRSDLAVDLIGQAIAINPSHPVYHSSLGVALAGLDRPAEALAASDTAIGLKPDFAEAHSNRGNQLRDLGRFEEAVTAYETAVGFNPNYVDAHYNLGIALAGRGRADAAAAFSAAIRCGASWASAYFHLANSLRQAGRLEEALQAYDAAIRLAPEGLEAHINRGVTLSDLGRKEEAVAAYDGALHLCPTSADAHTNRGAALHDLGRTEEALAAHDAAIALTPGMATAHYNRGNAFLASNRLEEALACYDRAIALEPGRAEAYSNKGAALTGLGRLQEAVAAYHDAIRVKPDHAEAHYNEAFAHLLDGRLEEGWPKYEWRFRGGDKTLRRRDVPQPQWNGEDLAGRTILLHAEQGLGDTIQFCRYAPLVAARGARVMLEAPKSVLRLLSGLKGVDQLVAAGETPPHFDLHCPLMSLPGVLGTRLETVPADVPYLEAESEVAQRWRARLGPEGFRIGVTWQGNPAASAEQGRSVPLADFEPLARIPGVRLISLQKVHGLDQLDNLPPGMTVETLGADFDAGPDAFVDTAGVMTGLDLIVSVDTAVGHLAGALARPTWLALQKVPHWVWGLEGETTPWYPRTRLFRQARRGDWKEVFGRMAEALPGLVAAR